jgi:hypothetical protein
MKHPEDVDLHAWVAGALPLAEAQALEAHTAQCELCAHKLMRTAQADELMYTAGKSRRVTHRKQWALAAGLLLMLGASSALHAGRHGGGVVNLGEVICPDGDDQHACIADAHAHGRVVSYPANANLNGNTDYLTEGELP